MKVQPNVPAQPQVAGVQALPLKPVQNAEPPAPQVPAKPPTHLGSNVDFHG